MVMVRFKKLSPRASLPAYQTALAAGMDLAACLPDGESIVIDPGMIRRIPTGLSMALPAGYEAQIRPRSGLASNHGITLPNAPGTIDADYRGEILIPLINHGKVPYTITHGLRIAQMIIAPVMQATVIEVDALDETERGHRGFGSTGGH